MSNYSTSLLQITEKEVGESNHTSNGEEEMNDWQFSYWKSCICVQCVNISDTYNGMKTHLIMMSVSSFILLLIV